MAEEEQGNLDRFGWGPGQLSYIDDNGNKVRIGEISPEDQKIIDKLKAQREQPASDARPKPRKRTSLHFHRR